MAAALIAAASLFALGFPPPVASFSAPAVVSVGQTVQYVDHSYDPAPGHSIVLVLWIGRAAAFYTPGAHVVSLVVEDDRALWGQTSRTIYVVARRPPPPPPPPRPPAAQLAATPSTVARGDSVSLTLSAPSDATAMTLSLPQTFLDQVPLPTGAIDYPAINRPSWVFRGGVWHATIWVPWTEGTPADGTYAMTVRYDQAGTTLSASTDLTVHGTDRLALWRVY